VDKKFLMTNLLGVFLVISGMPAISFAQNQSTDALMSKVATHLQQKFGGPNNALIKVFPPETELNLTPCNKLDISVPGGPSSINGNIRVGVKCLQTNGWTIFLSANVQQKKTYFITKRQIPYGEILKSEDLVPAQDFPDNIPMDAVLDLRQAVGRGVVEIVEKNTAILSRHFSNQAVISNGQAVKVLVQGNGFKITSDGKALGNATVGQSVKIKLNSGQVVTAVAKTPGYAEIVK
jgi:flagella basal body P-ring formation protein FlgA